MATGKDKALGLNDLSELLEELHDVTPKWYKFGIHLQLSVSFLEGLKSKEDQLMYVLSEWLQKATEDRPPATWATIVAVLKTKSLGYTQLAEKLERTYVTGQKPVLQQSVSLPTLDHVATTGVLRSQSDNADIECDTTYSHQKRKRECVTFSPTLQSSSDQCAPLMSSISGDSETQSQQPQADDAAVKSKPPRRAYGCGCGYCSLETYRRGGCPNPVETTSKFPYINMANLKQTEVDSLIGRLESESTDMAFHFQSLVSDMIISFSKQPISPSMLVAHLKSLGTIKRICTQEAAYFRDRFQDIENACDINKIFSIVQEYMSFINPGVVEHLIEKMGTEQDKERLQKYQQLLEDYCRRRVVECPSEYAAPGDGARIVIKLDEQLQQFTLSELCSFQSRLARLLQLTEYTLLLCTVKDGCLQLTYHIPAFVAKKVFPLSPKQEARLQQEGVLSLQCGNYHYQSSSGSLDNSKIKVPSEAAEASPMPTGGDTKRRQCSNFMILRQCSFGERCRYLHDQQAERVFTGYIKIPDHIPTGMVIGRGQRRLSDVKSTYQCVVEVEARELKVTAANEEELKGALDYMKLSIAKIYTLAPQWSYFHTDGITENSQLFFHEYGGKRPPNLKPYELVYEMCCREEPTVVHSETHYAEPHTLDEDSETVMRGALDTLHGKGQQFSADQVVSAMKANRPRFMGNYRAQIRLRLEEALKWFQQNREPQQAAKLEARFGKKLWFYLPPRVVSAERMNVEAMEEFLFYDTKYAKLFHPNVRTQSADCLYKRFGTAYSVQMAFDLKFTTTKTDKDRGGVRYSARVRDKEGRPEPIVVKKGSSNVVLFDVICLHRQNDIRFALSQFEVVSRKEFAVVDNLLQTVSFPKPNTIEVVPTSDSWSVDYIRHRNSRTYLFQDKYFITVTTVTEYNVDYKFPKDELLTVNVEDLQKDQHIEVEFNNIAWDSAFGRDIGWTPEEALSTYMDSPTIPRGVSDSIPHPWEPATILQGLNEFMDKADQINESLT